MKVNKIQIWLISLVFISLAAGPARAFEPAEGELLFEIRIPVTVGAEATAKDRYGNEHNIGEVLAVPSTSRYPSYSASAWGQPGHVCASAVNAVHLLVAVEKTKDGATFSGRTISVIPKETIAPAAGVNAAFVLAAQASEGIFGAWAPPVGTEVRIQAADGSLRHLYDGLPKKGEVLVMCVYESSSLPYFVEIENRPGGRVTAWDKSGYYNVARVIRGVSGTGRFEGTLFQRGSRLRANHTGVIDFSTGGRGKMGGFQIIPWDHALFSKEMQGAWDMTQWMILGSIDGKSPLAGHFPLFDEGLVPGPSEEELMWDLWSSYGRRSLILVRLDGGEWQFMPIVSGRNDDGLRSVTHLRIYYPITGEPLK